MKTQTLSPLGDRERFAGMDEYAVAPHVTILHCARNPSAISWAVILVVLLAVYGVFGGRAWTHVRIEGHERFTPPLANLDSAATIILETRILSVVASGNHCVPDLVFGGARQSMLVFPSSAQFPRKAPAALLAFVKIRRGHDRNLAAFAIALPHQFLLLAAADERTNGESTKLLANEISARCSKSDWFFRQSHECQPLERRLCFCRLYTLPLV